MGLYERFDATPDGPAVLAAARLSRTIEVAIHEAGVALPRRWFRRRSVSSLTVTEVAQLMESAGRELDVTLVPYGELRRRAVGGEA